MDRSWESNALGTVPAMPPTPSVGYPTDGNIVGLIPATNPGAWWFHMLTEEIRNVITAQGIVPTAANVGQLLQALDARYAGASSATGRLLRITTFTANGTWNLGAGTHSILVKGVGGGGGAGGGAQGNGGAGAGGYFEKIINNPALSYAIGIGQGGNASGSNGGDTTFDVLCVGRGGAGVTPNVWSGGIGGSASGGDINFTGGGGGWGGIFFTNPDQNACGAGGNSPFGGGGPGRINLPGVPGASGTGGGASGGIPTSGAIGGSGIVIVYEYA